MSINIDDRLVLILKEQMTPLEAEDIYRSEGLIASVLVMFSNRKFAGRGFWEKLATKTGIASQRWRSVFMRRQKATPEMIEIIAKLWPKYAFFLATGITDTANGHTAPLSSFTFPEKSHVENYWANQYFEMSLNLLNKLYQTTDIKSSATWINKPAEAEELLTSWKGSDLEIKASLQARTEFYIALIDCWKKREDNRMDHIERLCNHSNKSENPNDWDLFYKAD